MPDPVVVAHRLLAALGALILVAATMVLGAPSSQAVMPSGRAAGSSEAAAGPTIAITDTLSSLHVPASPGTTVTWVNKDGDSHRIKSDKGASVEFDSGVLEPGDRFTHTFSSVGDVTYHDARNTRDSSYFGMVMVRPDAERTSTTNLAPAPALFTGGTAAAQPSAFSTAASDFPDYVEVEIHNKNEFRPGTITIAQGGTVEWYNDHSDIHTATGAGGIDSGDLDRDERYSKTFNKPGTYDYVCIYHERMKATVKVADANGNVPPPANGGGGGTPPPPSNGGEQVAVSIGSNFSPGNVTVPVGSVVTWTNDDSAPHTATGTGWDSGMLTTGQTWSRTFNQAGTFEYVCDYHANMTGTVQVTGEGGEVPPPPPPDDNPPPPDDNPPPPPDDNPPPPDNGGEAPTTAAVALGDDYFQPRNVTVAVGGTVNWTNNGSSPHTVTGNGFDSGMLTSGGKFKHTFTTAGTYNYVCDYHSDMTATVTVTDGSGEAPPPPDNPPPPPPDNPPPPPGNDPAPPNGGAKAPAKASVAVGDDFFKPRTATIRVGGTVTWTNNGSNPHTATGSGFDSGMLMAGDKYTKKFTKAGTYNYDCAYHSDMTGTVKVMNADGNAPPRGGGDNGPGGGNNGPGKKGPGGKAPGGGSAPSVPSAPGAETHTITMGATSFSPKVLSARVGDTVVFKNGSSVPHNVEPLTSDLIMGGQSYTTVLREQGTLNYKCTIHPGMSGTIKVAAAPAGTKLPPPSADEGVSGGSSGALGSTGSSGSSSSSGSSGGTASPTAESHTVSMVNSTFDPQVLQARVGDEVTWVNDDPIPHNVTGGPLDSGMVMGGGEYTTVLTEAGTIEYDCTLHPGMTGTLEVAEALPGTEVPPASSSTTSSGSTDTAASGGGETTPSAEPEAGSKNHTVDIVDFLYEPDPLEVNVGDTVTFVNKDAAPHTATADDKSWDSGNMNQGDEWTLEVEKPGEVPYFCIYHPNMTGTLIVKPKGEEIAAAPAASDSGGSDTASTSASQIAGFSSGWLALLVFLAGMQLQSRLASRRRTSSLV
ncbi:MAG TPA: cupredoxin domain-containing protein [Nocardioidaceae bacterium]|nr:cupredoxin domain-containing protein [Nocardioidaceae bacterium]